jgi:xanthine dehydrogenase YagS FAD-binding subunit
VTPFSFAKAESLDAAVSAGASGARFIAGGTTLVDLMRIGVETPAQLLDINALPLDGIRVTAAGLAIGALTRMSELAAHPIVMREYPAISAALVEGATPQLRNMASIGGNLLQRVRCPYFRDTTAACNKRSPGAGCASIGGFNRTQAILGTSGACIAAHPSDVAVAFVALDARVHVRGVTGARELALEELFRLPGETPHVEHNLEPGDVIVGVEVPATAYARNSCYVKIRDRASYEFALVSVAAAIETDGGRIRTARLAAGGVGTTPWRFRRAEALLAARMPDEDAWSAAADACVAGAVPASQNGFKVQLLRRTVQRALAHAGRVA